MPNPSDDGDIPLGRAVLYNDETVPERQHVDAQWGDNQLVDQYPDHTRVVSRAHMNTCTLAYAVSFPGARRLMYELGMREINKGFDLMLRDMCDGTDGRRRQNCLSVHPQLFQHFRPIARKGSFSDVGGKEGPNEYTEVAFARNIRWATIFNIPKLVNGVTDYLDHFEDRQPRLKLDYR